MPKYYIIEGTAHHTVIEADSPLQACFRAITYRFDGIPLDGFYRISEQGLEPHEDDIIFSADEVIYALMNMMNKKNTKRDEKKPRHKRKKPKKDEEED
tara:strand:+ start:812 stop:1105 length:294 start_codon:yes stop_codon:yes gene_type:complete